MYDDSTAFDTLLRCRMVIGLLVFPLSLFTHSVSINLFLDRLSLSASLVFEALIFSLTGQFIGISLCLSKRNTDGYTLQ